MATPQQTPPSPRPGAFGALWRGHVFLFDKPHQPATFGAATGVRLLLIAVGVEGIRLLRSQLGLSVLPLAVEMLFYLGLALAAARFVARVRWPQIGFVRWSAWNAIEKSYFVQVVILVNVVFLMLFGARLRTALADPSAMGTVFVPYLIYGFYQEVLYRGMLQTELVRRWGAIAGILVSNTLFAFGPLHFHYVASGGSPNVPMLASIFAIGLLFAIVFHRTGNLWIVATMHAFGNAYAVATFGAS